MAAGELWVGLYAPRVEYLNSVGSGRSLDLDYDAPRSGMAAGEIYFQAATKRLWSANANDMGYCISHSNAGTLEPDGSLWVSGNNVYVAYGGRAYEYTQ